MCCTASGLEKRICSRLHVRSFAKRCQGSPLVVHSWHPSHAIEMRCFAFNRHHAMRYRAALESRLTANCRAVTAAVYGENKTPAKVTTSAVSMPHLQVKHHSDPQSVLQPYDRSINTYVLYCRAALESRSTANRMAVAAAVAGDPEEARFWQKLPGTLAKLKSLAMPSQQVHPFHLFKLQHLRL